MKWRRKPAMHFPTQKQRAEALRPVNRWYCSQHFKCNVHDPDALMEYFIRSGGAADFARRYNDALGPVNRWYCSQFHHQDVRDPETLWNYFEKYGQERPPKMPIA